MAVSDLPDWAGRPSRAEASDLRKGPKQLPLLLRGFPCYTIPRNPILMIKASYILEGLVSGFGVQGSCEVLLGWSVGVSYFAWLFRVQWLFGFVRAYRFSKSPKP